MFWGTYTSPCKYMPCGQHAFMILFITYYESSKLATSSSIIATFWLYLVNLPPYVGLVSFGGREREGEGRGRMQAYLLSIPNKKLDFL